MDMVMWNLENSLRRDMTTVCFPVHSFIHASTPTSFGSSVISISVTTALLKTSTPTFSTPNIPSPALFWFFFSAFIIFQYTILCFYLLCLVLGFSPQNRKPGGESWGVLVTTVLQHLEQCLVVNTHLLTEWMRELKYLRSLRRQARS